MKFRFFFSWLLSVSIVRCSILPEKSTLSGSGVPTIVEVMDPTETLATTDELMTMTKKSIGKVVNIMIGGKDFIVKLAGLTGENTTGIEVTVVDLGEQVMIQTIDPEGRYLPTSMIVNKDRDEDGELTVDQDGAVEVVVEQIDAGEEWVLRPYGFIRWIERLKQRMLGISRLDNLNEFLSEYLLAGGINVIMPVNLSLDSEVEVNVYQTPAPNTVLVQPIGVSYGGFKDAAPLKQYETAYIVVYMISLSFPIIYMITAGQNATVPDLLGVDWEIYQLNQSLEAKYKKGNVYFTFDVKNTICGSEDELGLVIDQEPEAGTTINSFDQLVTVYVCNEVVVSEVEMPDFIGKPIIEAKTWLEEKGFNYDVIDGNSEYDLDIVYDQLPLAGDKYDPRFITVYLFRTAKKLLPFSYVVLDCVEWYHATTICNTANNTCQLKNVENQCMGNSEILINMISINDNGNIDYSTNTIIYEGYPKYFESVNENSSFSVPEQDLSTADHKITINAFNIRYTRIDTINVLGMNRSVIVLSGDYYVISVNKPDGDTLIYKVTVEYSYDQEYGLLLRSELQSTLDGCKPSCSGLEGTTVMKSIAEIVESDWINE